MVKVLDAEVRRGILEDHEDDHPASNSPSLKVSFDDLPDNEDYEYRRYFTDESDKFVWVGIPYDQREFMRLYMWYDRETRKSNGFGGRVFEFKRPNGETAKVKGPWGTNFGVVYKYSLPSEYQMPTVEVSVRAETEKFPHMYKGGTYLRGKLLVDALKAASEDLPGSWHWVAVRQGNIWDIAPLKVQNHRAEAPFFVPLYDTGKVSDGELSDAQNSFIERG